MTKLNQCSVYLSLCQTKQTVFQVNFNLFGSKSVTSVLYSITVECGVMNCHPHLLSPICSAALPLIDSGQGDYSYGIM